ncbi:uncharacterized protein [Temnothorax nylanderi]|uniref:uncharacterized protein n=1 Tax=Temnothorax nylanderi TaxID=102681 RepID=UPI003A868445
MDRFDYINRMTEVLSDASTYKKVDKNPIKQITTKINQLVKSWHDNDIIDYQIFKQLYCTNGNLPRCYGLPKIHKTGFPMRVIVSAIGSPLYSVARFIHEILHDSIPKPRSHVKDGWSFVKGIANVRIGSDEVLVSLDVTALFTNIPNESVYESVRKRWNYISQNTKLSLPQFLHAIELILHSTSFCFDGKFYEQIHGSPMESPLSPILADMVMEDLETHCLSLLDFDVRVYLRYVDDVFTIVPKRAINVLLEAFNGYHPRLRFTYEIETGDSLPFLDTIVIRDGDELITNWYRKPTFSGRYINYFSNHPLKYKINSINNLVDHAILLSDERFHHANINIIKNILVDNSFPIKLGNKHINNRLRQLENRRDLSTNSERDSTFDVRRCVVIPYVKGLSAGIRGTLERVRCDVVYKIPKKLSAVIRRGKDRLATNRETNVVYKIDSVMPLCRPTSMLQRVEGMRRQGCARDSHAH